MAAYGERLILESDWDQVLREKDGKAWISYKVPGRQTVHGELLTQGHSEDGTPYIIGSEGFSVHEICPRSLKASHSNEGMVCTRQFLAPITSFSQVHAERKSVHCVDVTPGGLAVSSDTEGKIKIWETASGSVRRDLEGHFGDIYTCRFFPSGIVVLSGGSDMQLKIWSAETGKCAATLVGHTAGVLDSAIVDRGRNIVSCSQDGTAKLWDCGTASCLTSFSEIGGIVNCCSLDVTHTSIDLGQPDTPASEQEASTEGKILLLGCENSTLQGYGLHSRKKIFELPCHGAVTTCCFLSDVCVACGTQDGHITITDIRNIRVPVKEWKECRSAILSMTPWQKQLFTSTGDGSCFCVDGNFETIVEFTGSDCDPIYKLALDGKYLFTACRDGFIRKYNLRDIQS